MKDKRIIAIVLAVVLTIISAVAVYTIFFKQDKDTTLTMIERQWIESNKNKVIDLAIINQVPVVSYNGEGIFFDFLKSLEENTNLSFNKVAYNLGSEIKGDYAFQVVEKIEKNQIEVYTDNYVLVTKKGKIYNSVDDIKDMTVGVLSSKLSDVNTYLNTNSSLLLKSYENYNDMFFDISVEQVDTSKQLDGVVVPKTAYLNQILGNENLTISYNISEMKEYYVLKLGNIDKLNTILKKYFEKWYRDSYFTSYEDQFFHGYFEFSNADDKQKVEFKSKRYVYGFVDNRPYDTLYDGKYLGINNSLITSFTNLSDVEIDYKRYSSIEELVKDFNANNIDMFFNNTSYNTFQMDVINTLSAYDEKAVILTNPKSNYQINSFASLKNKEVYTVRYSYLSNNLLTNGVAIKEFNSLKSLLSSIEEDTILVLDLDTYNYYASKELKNYKINYIHQLPIDYTFTIRNISDNRLFGKFFNFYLSFFSNDLAYEKGYEEVLIARDTKISPKTIIFAIIGILFAGICIFFGIKSTSPKKTQKVKINLSKEDKIKYIDMLTSLKNRSYLNDNIEKWDNSGVYPQTVVIIDLNNIAYINDNYGHAEGDKIIGEAANILINTQLPNTEIIRTNGNEFLIYMVGYEERQVISYMKKLNKEFKMLTHGFGAALGYSMITDAIKTVDDAINEATTDMKENKEELDY